MAKVRDLLAVLANEDPDQDVVLEGCDCYGDWGGKVDHIAGEDRWNSTVGPAEYDTAAPGLLLLRDDNG